MPHFLKKKCNFANIIRTNLNLLKMKKFLLTIIATVLMAGSISAQNVARKCVLVEAFTGINCGYCPAAAGGIGEMVKQGLSVAPLAFHCDYYTPDDKDYSTSETESRGSSFYKVRSYPTVIIDGVSSPAVGGTASQYMSSYTKLKAEYDKRINVESPFELELTFEYDSWNKCRAKAVVKKVGECASNDVRLFIALTESHIQQSWGGWTELNAVVRDIVTSTSGVKLTGDSEVITALFDVHNFKKENCELVAWLQNQDTNKEVFQAVKISIGTEPAKYDLGISNIEEVSTESCSGKMKPVLTIKNHGSETLKSAVFKVTDDANNDLGSYTWEGTLATKKETYFELPEINFGGAGYVKVEAKDLNGNNVDEYAFDNIFGYEVATPLQPQADGKLTFQLKTSDTENLSIDIIDMDKNNVIETLTFTEPNKVVKLEYVLPEEGCYRIVLKNKAGNGIGDGTSYWGILDSKKNKIVTAKPGELPFRNQYVIELAYGSLGIEDVVVKDVNVYPNPAKSIVNVYAENLNRVSVFNNIGQLVYTSTTDSDELVINVESWTNGLYYINLETKDGAVSSQKVIVNK